MRWDRLTSRMWRAEVYTGYWWGNLEEKRIGRPTHMWETNTKMDLQEIGWGTLIKCIWLRTGRGGGNVCEVCLEFSVLD